MTNEEIVAVFENIAELLKLKNELIFKIRAYQKAARTIDNLPIQLAQYIKEGNDLQRLPGIGEAIARKIQEMVTTGTLKYYEELKASSPDAETRIDTAQRRGYL